MAKLEKPKIPFTQVANEVLNDKRLSWRAKGIFAYLFSKPDDWDFNGDRIADDASDGRKMVFAGLLELEALGYLSRNKLPDGRMEYHLKFSADPVDPQGQKEPVAPTGNFPLGQIAPGGNISNKEEENKKEKKIIQREVPLDPASRFFSDASECEALIQVLVSQKSVPEPLARAEIAKFISYWTEQNARGKQRWQFEKVFDVKRRLATWFSRAGSFQRPNQTRQQGLVL